MMTWTWERVKRRTRPAPCASEFTCRCRAAQHAALSCRLGMGGSGEGIY